MGLVAALAAAALFACKDSSPAKSPPPQRGEGAGGGNKSGAADLEPGGALLTAQDYSNLASKLGSKCEELPRMGTPEFARMSAERNVAAIDRPGAASRGRLAVLMPFLEPLTLLMKAYISCGIYPEGHFMVALVFEYYARMVPILDDFLDRFPSDDPSYQTRVQGRDKMRRGLTNMLLGLVAVVASRTNSDTIEPALDRLVTALARLRQVVPAEVTEPALATLDRASAKNSPVQKALARLAAALRR